MSFPVAGFTEASPRRSLPLQTRWLNSLMPKCPPKNSREWSPVSAKLCTFPFVESHQIRAPELPLSRRNAARKFLWRPKAP